MLGELVPCGGGDPIPLLKPNLLIGRRSSCDITLRFSNVSSHHCKLDLLNGFWHVQDLSSRNGVKVNDVRCEGKWLLPGDILCIAKHRYEILYQSSGEVPELEEPDPMSVSLLEKAGLVERKPTMPKSVNAPSIDTEQVEASIDDDIAIDWLEEEN